MRLWNRSLAGDANVAFLSLAMKLEIMTPKVVRG
jgi:hypothetical protein